MSYGTRKPLVTLFKGYGGLRPFTLKRSKKQSSQKTTISSTPTRATTASRKYVITGESSVSSTRGTGFNNFSHQQNDTSHGKDSRPILIGISISITLLLIGALVATLAFIRTRRKQRAKSDAKEIKGNPNGTMEYDDVIMNDIAYADRKASNTRDAYDDVIEENRDAASHDAYEYIIVQGDETGKYKSLGREDPSSIYQEIGENFQDITTWPSAGAPEYKNCTNNPDRDYQNDVDSKNKDMANVEAGDDYLVPIQSADEANNSQLYSSAYIKVLP